MNSSTHNLPREERLRGCGALSRIFAEGHSGFAYPLRYVWVERTDEAQPAAASVLFTVPKRLHKRANKRNLLRRRIKEAYRLNKLVELSGLNLALIYTTKELHDYQRIEKSVVKALAQIAKEREESK